MWFQLKVGRFISNVGKDNEHKKFATLFLVLVDTQSIVKFRRDSFMLTAKEARDITIESNSYIWSTEHFIDETFKLVRKYAEEGKCGFNVIGHCKHHPSFMVSLLDVFRDLGYEADYDEDADILVFKW